MLERSLDSAPILAHTGNDEAMIQQIRNKLALVIPDPGHIEVKVRGSVVTLSGKLLDSAQRRAATLITHRVDGVTNVVNKLTLGHEGVFHAALRAPVARRTKGTVSRKAAIVGATPLDAPTDDAA